MRILPLFRYEFHVHELTHSALQGWIWDRQELLSDKVEKGWRIIGISAVGPQQILVMLRRRRWRWQ